jgi:hypothetical protein
MGLGDHDEQYLWVKTAGRAKWVVNMGETNAVRAHSTRRREAEEQDQTV